MTTDSRIDFAVDRDFGQVMSKTFLFFQQNFRALARITFLIMGPVIVLYSIYDSLLMLSINELQPEGTFVDMMSQIMLLQLPAIIVLLVALVFYQALIYTYLESYINQQENDLTNRQLIKEALRLTLPMMGITVVLLVAMFVSMITIIFAIYIWIATAMSFIILVHEKRGVFGSIGRSFDMVAGHWWETFALILVLTILGYVISTVVAIPQAIVDIVLRFNQLQDYEMLVKGLRIFFGIIAYLGGFITYVFGFIGISMQYFSIREKKEMPGLMARIDTLASHLASNASGPNSPNQDIFK